jgi:signal transduction histidine kinase
MDAGRLTWATVQHAVRRVGRSPALDVVLAAALGCYAALDALRTTDFPQPHSVSAALVAVSAAFLVLRRGRPLTGLAGALGGLAAVYLAVGHYEAGAAVLIALIATYSAGAYGRNLAFTAAVVFAFGVTTGLREGAAEALPDMAWSWVVLGLALGGGLTARRLRGQSQSARRQVQQLRHEQQALAEAAAREERQRIARELHDIISHGVGVMVLQAGAAEQVLDTDLGKAREALQLIRATGQEAITELGTLVALIRDEQPPGRDPQPTLHDVERLAATTRSAGLAVCVQTEGEPRDLPASVELNAYRVIQEGLTNALKHAPGSAVQVIVRYHPGGLDVEVRDDGADSAGGPGTRRGLAGLRERAAVFGGQFEAGRDPQGGWKVRASFPAAP